MKECSECGQWSAGSAKKCKHCGVSFDKYPPKEIEDVAPDDEFEDDGGVVLTPKEIEEFKDLQEEEEANGQQRKREQSGVYWVFMAGGILIGVICGGLLGDATGGILAVHGGVGRRRGSVGGYLGLAVGVIAAHFLYKMFFESNSEE
jgi:rubredoxin